MNSCLGRWDSIRLHWSAAAGQKLRTCWKRPASVSCWRTKCSKRQQTISQFEATILTNIMWHHCTSRTSHQWYSFWCPCSRWWRIVVGANVLPQESIFSLKACSWKHFGLEGPRPGMEPIFTFMWRSWLSRIRQTISPEILVLFSLESETTDFPGKGEQISSLWFLWASCQPYLLPPLLWKHLSKSEERNVIPKRLFWPSTIISGNIARKTRIHTKCGCPTAAEPENCRFSVLYEISELGKIGIVPIFTREISE